MAKRPSSRAKATDPTDPAQPKRKRARSAAAPAESTSADTPPAEPSVDDIRRRAYQRYLERGGLHGQHFDDWLEAEKELRTKK
jgi:hypothetical protein